jgi:hypothetical protein
LNAATPHHVLKARTGTSFPRTSFPRTSVLRLRVSGGNTFVALEMARALIAHGMPRAARDRRAGPATCFFDVRSGAPRDGREGCSIVTV